MLGLFELLQTNNSDPSRQVYTVNSYSQSINAGVVRNRFSQHTWNKPQGAQLVYFFCLGAGSGGGAGSTLVQGNGGGSGASTSLLLPGFMVPDKLFISVGRGGIGGVAGGGALVTGSIGRISYISTDVSFDASTIFTQGNQFLISGDTSPDGGAPNVQGAAGTVLPITSLNCVHHKIGFLSMNNGVIGNAAADFAYANGTEVRLTMGGCGGASTAAGNGFIYTKTNPSFGVEFTRALTGAIGQNGMNGDDLSILSDNTVISFGGCGGGGGSTTLGGNGGNANFGSGGGGGGRGTTAGGNGGKGGDGLVVIITL